MARQQFKDASRTYASYANAKKVIDKLVDDNYAWMIIATEGGRFVPHILLSNRTCQLSHFYFLEKGCCVNLID